MLSPRAVRGLLIAAVALAVLLSVALVPYFGARVYDFPEPVPFSGPEIHNPYDGLGPGCWSIGNFHAHARNCGGLTDGVGTDEEVLAQYRRIGYDFAGLSNYHRIAQIADPGFYVPAYEHGFGLRKWHQVVVGAREVTWLDFPLFQSRSHKQTIIDRIRRANPDAVIAIAHPALRGAYTVDDLSYLSGYDCVEALSRTIRSMEAWDAALSAGHPVWILGSDDVHDAFNVHEVGRCGTAIASDDASLPGMLNALRRGRSIGVAIPVEKGETFEERRLRVEALEDLESVTVSDGRLVVKVSDLAEEIRFIGQRGALRGAAAGVTEAAYDLRDDDTYIRTEIRFAASGNEFFLNPVFRCDGRPPEPRAPIVDPVATAGHHLIVVVLLVLIWTPTVLLVRARRKRLTQNADGSTQG